MQFLKFFNYISIYLFFKKIKGIRSWALSPVILGGRDGEKVFRTPSQPITAGCSVIPAMWDAKGR
jgi:hypothetical protein